MALDFYFDYELPYIRQGLFRVFVGVGPNFIVAPSYKGFAGLPEGDKSKKLGSRVTGSLKVGVTILDNIRVGTRLASSDMIDGYEGLQDNVGPDVISFLNISYRFNLK